MKKQPVGIMIMIVMVVVGCMTVNALCEDFLDNAVCDAISQTPIFSYMEDVYMLDIVLNTLKDEEVAMWLAAVMSEGRADVLKPHTQVSVLSKKKHTSSGEYILRVATIDGTAREGWVYESFLKVEKFAPTR